MEYKCHCIIHVYNGIGTNVNKEMQIVESDSEENAISQVENKIKNRYRTMSHLSLSSVAITIASKENEGK
jgi:hypothetical protein